jgi:sugar fermentation stimulation protein A
VSWTEARFLRREKRFTIHAELLDGTAVLAHTNNTGRLTGCTTPGGRCWLSRADNPRRRLPWILEVTEAPGGVLVGVNTAAPMRLVAEALQQGFWPQMAGNPLVRREARYPDPIAPNSRADLLLDGPVWVELKNVTLTCDGLALFPDAPTTRGRKHLADLMACVAVGHRAALIFCVQRADAEAVAPARGIDPEYADMMIHAQTAGVELMALQARISPEGVFPWRILPVQAT